MSKRIWNFTKTSVIMVFATIFATLGLNAADNIDDLSNSMLGSVFFSEKSQCPNEMVFVPSDTINSGFCMDMYEVSAGEKCPFKNPRNSAETRSNLEQPGCMPESTSQTIPWRNITQNQAATACRLANKRLPSNKEWYEAAIGTPDVGLEIDKTNCNFGSVGITEPEKTGERSRCISASGAYDMIGNVWEWVNGYVMEGKFKDVEVPVSGFIYAVNIEGIPIETNREVSSPDTNDDYFWVDLSRVAGMLRGGYWGNDTRAGVYALNATVPATFSGDAVGFRCVK
jgi:formylglycine-generating enzyme required for sulfatase activity